ncbi:hypothetical protein Pme01_44350 [Planosporangium mesophilum]|uniref:Uncharacterized protein n=1 Tax=Planosporangium mesophilum TaxID=689768 RepID=A0A8J3TE83_9ACTN|nr:hypothetical protein [Planosporangium mesophilum]GII24838.1 hypothetical protein Pme01_44350 [Planosporangium mesophilum]
MTRPAVSPGQTSTPREAFVEWQQRFGQPGMSALRRLDEVKAQRGVIGDDDVRRIAAELGWPVAALSGTASFYADLAGTGRGRRHVRVCTGTSCFVSTLGRHVTQAETALGVPCDGCASDGSVSLQGVHCLGYCYASPAALDGDRPRTGPSLGGLLEPADGDEGTAPPVPYRSTGRRAVVLAGMVGAEGPWEVWPGVLAAGSPAHVIAEVGKSGLRGRGGAGFSRLSPLRRSSSVRWASRNSRSSARSARSKTSNRSSSPASRRSMPACRGSSVDPRDRWTGSDRIPQQQAPRWIVERAPSRAIVKTCG